MRCLLCALCATVGSAAEATPPGTPAAGSPAAASPQQPPPVAPGAGTQGGGSPAAGTPPAGTPAVGPPDESFLEFLGSDDVGDTAWWEFLKKAPPPGSDASARPPQDAKK